MSAVARYRANSPSVVWEEFEDEIILVNLETGQYFSLRDAGSEIWRRLAKGAAPAAVEKALLALYAVEPAILVESVATFTTALLEHGLLVTRADAEAVELVTAPPVSEKRTFVPPAIETHSDMQDLLLLDPIHEVDESGWPKPNPK